MCLGIPGRIVRIDDVADKLATVDVGGGTSGACCHQPCGGFGDDLRCRQRSWLRACVRPPIAGAGQGGGHHLVIKGGKIANYHRYPPTPWNGTPRDRFGTPGSYEDAVKGTPILEENFPDKFKGIDIMRAVRSFDPCLPRGVHMYPGNGKTLKTVHSPMFGIQRADA